MIGSAQNTGKAFKTLALLAKLNSEDLKTLKVQIIRKNIPELPNPVPLERGLGDPALLEVHHRPGEGEKPIFDRDDVLVNKPDDEEKVVLRQHNRRSRSPSNNSKNLSSANERTSRSYSPRSPSRGARGEKCYREQASVKSDNELKERSHGQTQRVHSRSRERFRSRSPYRSRDDLRSNAPRTTRRSPLQQRSRSPFVSRKSRSPGSKRQSGTPGGTRISPYKGGRSRSPGYHKNIDKFHHSRSPDQYRSSISPTNRAWAHSEKSRSNRSPSGRHRAGDKYRSGSPSRRERSSQSPHRQERHSRLPYHRKQGVFTKEDYERSMRKSKSPSKIIQQYNQGNIKAAGPTEEMFMGLRGYPYYGGEGYWFPPHLARPPFIPYAPGPLPRHLGPPPMYPRIPIHPEFRPRFPVYNHTKVKHAAPTPATVTTTTPTETSSVSTTSVAQSSVTIEEVSSNCMEGSSNVNNDVSSGYCDTQQEDEETT